MSNSTKIPWEPQVKDKFKQFIEKMPIFHRRIAEELINEQAQQRAQKRNSNIVNEEDFLNAVFDGVPKPFYTMMVRLLEELDFDYNKYGLPKVDQ